MRVTDAIGDWFAARGIEHYFGYSGAAALPILDGLVGHPEIEAIQPKHESHVPIPSQRERVHLLTPTLSRSERENQARRGADRCAGWRRRRSAGPHNADESLADAVELRAKNLRAEFE